MIQQEVFEKVLAALNESGIDYLITGSIAAIRYGKPRVTHDIDLVVKMTSDQAEKLTGVLGGEFHADLVDIKEAIREKIQFNIIHPTTGLKIDFWPVKDDYDKSRFDRRIQALFGKVSAYFAASEDVILKKLEWVKQGGSARHLEDIKGILAIQEDKIDRDYIAKWAEKLGVKELLKEVKL